MKIITALFFLGFLCGCVQNTVFLGPAYTIGATGNVLQAGASYGSSHVVRKLTGKTTSENIKTIFSTSKIKAYKNANSEDKKENPEEFFKIVRKQIEKTSKTLNLEVN